MKKLLILLCVFFICSAFSEAATDLFITAGDSRVLVLTVKDQNYDTVDITDATIAFTVKDKYYVQDSSAAIQKTSLSGGGITLSDPTNGQAQITLTPSDTDPDTNADLDLATYYYDVQVQLYGRTYTVVIGNITFTRHITHDTF